MLQCHYRGSGPGMSIQSTRNRDSPDHLPVSEMARTGRRGVIAGDVRRGEVGLADSSGEAANNPKERISGAKERPRERGTATHAPDTEPGKHVTEAVTRAGSCETERTVYSIVDLLTVGALQSHPLPEQESCRSGWHQVDGLRRKHEDNITILRRLHQGSSRAQPGRRHYIPKADGKQRRRHRLAGGARSSSDGVVKILNAVV